MSEISGTKTDPKTPRDKDAGVAARNAASDDWSDREKEILDEMRAQGASESAIAARILEETGRVRSIGAIAVKCSRMGARLGGRTRKCLVCRRTFHPSAKVIYICDSCKEDPAFRSGGEYSLLPR